MTKKAVKAKKAAATALPTFARVGTQSMVRLSDPELKSYMSKQVKRLSTDRAYALEFLQDIGVATPTGKLSKRFGG